MPRVFPLATLLLLLPAVACGPPGGQLPGPSPSDDDDDEQPLGGGDVVLNEVRSLGGDPIELFNTSDETVDLEGWSLLDGNNSHDRYFLPEGSEVEPGGFLVFDDSQTGLGLGDSDEVRLYDAEERLIERVSWSDGEAAISWCRYPDGDDDWGECGIPTPGEPNSISAPDGVGEVVLNEIRATDGDRIELYNRGASTIDLEGWSLLDDNDAHVPYVLPEGTTLTSGGFLALNSAQTGLGLGIADSVRLFGPHGVVVDEAEWEAGMAEVSWCRYPDGAEDSWDLCTLATPGGPNTQDYSGVVIDPLWIAGHDQAHDPEVEVDEPNELAFDGTGKLWAGDQDNLRVQVFDLNGYFVGSVGGQGSGPGQFTPRSNGDNQGPESMRPGTDGMMYVIDRVGRRINVYDAATMEPQPSIADSGLLIDPCGLAIDGSDTLYVGDQNTNQIHVYSTDGEHLDTFETYDGWGSPILNKVETMAIDEPHDYLFATSEYESTVEVFRLSTGEYLGEHVTELRDDSGPTLQPGRITWTIEGIGTDEVNSFLFVADEEAGRIMLMDTDAGEDLFDPDEDFAFRGAFASSQNFTGVDGVFPAPAHDRVAIADQIGSRVQVFLLSDVYEALGLD
jgi:sugar lactone lactonase YvrE